MNFSDHETPTRPSNPTAGGQWDMLRRMFANLTPDERGRLLVLADGWFHCPANRRVLLEALAGELSG